MIRFNFFLLIVFLFSSKLDYSFAQADWVKWYKADNYLLKDSNYSPNIEYMKSETAIDNNSLSGFLVKIYKNIFSDFDGDNCSFNPSCSEFFAESTKLTNFFSATLLFFDRLTRDSNIFSKGGYKSDNNRFYDPPSEYIYE